MYRVYLYLLLLLLIGQWRGSAAIMDLTKCDSSVPICDFMSFVPMISPDPVLIKLETTNQQRVSFDRVDKTVTSSTFQLVARFRYTGVGRYEADFDEKAIRAKRSADLTAGMVVKHQLFSIQVAGTGVVLVSVSGTVKDGVPVVTQVTMKFNEVNQSPVSIGIHDLRIVNGTNVTENELVAVVNELTFRSGNEPRMQLQVASVKHKEDTGSLWARFAGCVKGELVNCMLKPVQIQVAGNNAVLGFGQALASGKREYAFPTMAVPVLLSGLR